MNKYLKCFSAIFSGIIGTFITAYLATSLAYKVNGGNLDMAIVQDGIFLLGGLMVGCTVFIVATIKENRK
jgi:hypothetical protein